MPRVVPPVYFLAGIVTMVLLHNLVPVAPVLGGSNRLIGAIPLLLGLALNITSAVIFRVSGTPLRPGSEATLLVQSGTFRMTRNPMYLGFSLALLGIALLLGSLSPLIVPPVFVVLIQVHFIRKEERWMEQRFGDEYLAYKRRTRRWI